MAKVIRRETEFSKETVDEMIKRFNRRVIEDGILKELRNREYYKSKGQKRREKKLKAEREAWVRKMKAARRRAY